MLTNLYYKRKITNDYTQSVKCYTKAAELGHKEAQYKLGKCTGVSQDKDTKWYKKSAAQENRQTQYNLE